MTNGEAQKSRVGDRVIYRGRPMVIMGKANRLAPGVPIVFTLAWPEWPTTIVYPSIPAKLVRCVDPAEVK